MKKLVSIILVISILFGAFSICSALNYGRLTRGDFFTLVAQTLKLEESDKASLTFSDYDNSNKNVNSLINSNLLLGRNDGTLSLDEDLCLADIEELFSRIDLTPKTEIKTEYKKKIIPLVLPLPYDKATFKHHCKSEDEHLYKLTAVTENDTNYAAYVCVYCKEEAPVGVINIDESIPFENSVISAWLETDSDDWDGQGDSITTEGHFLSYESGFECVNEDFFTIGYNAKCFTYDRSGNIVEIGFAEMFRNYGQDEDKTWKVKMLCEDNIASGILIIEEVSGPLGIKLLKWFR